MPNHTEGYPGQPADLGRDRGAGPSPAFAAEQWARQLPISAGALAVLLCLLDHLNWRDRRCDPGQARIARATKYCERAVRNFLRELERVGAVEISRVDHRCHYRILIGAVVEGEPRRQRQPRPQRQGKLDLGEPAAPAPAPVDNSARTGTTCR